MKINNKIKKRLQTLWTRSKFISSVSSVTLDVVKKIHIGVERKMILTYKIKHKKDFMDELIKAQKIAEYAVSHKRDFKSLSTKYVKDIGLKSLIANQILRKYGRNKKIKKIKKDRVKLIIPNQGIKVNKDYNEIYIPSLNLKIKYYFPNDFEKINQIELDNTYCYVSVTIPENPEITTNHYIGVDLNTTGHIAVVADPNTGKVLKLGKKGDHIHRKYSNIRKNLQKNGKYKKIKQLKNRENRIVKDLNHKVSRTIVDFAKNSNAGIRLENLTGIRENKKLKKSFKYSLNSWSFYQLRKMIEYKAKLLGIPVEIVDPHYTSQKCSLCGSIGKREGKKFKCPECGHVDHADVNAAFNVSMANTSNSIDQSVKDRDLTEGITDNPKEATIKMQSTLEPPML